MSPSGAETNSAGAGVSPSESPKEAEESRARIDSVSRFIAVAKDWIPLERVKGDVRVTPRGLFVHKDSLDILVECYQRWLHSIAPQAEEKQPARIVKRMFGTTTPALYYLVEQKRALVGHLIAAPVANPQSLGLPVYLGSLEDGAQQIHPKDPLLQCMPQLSVKHAPEGVQFILQLPAPLKRFSSLQFSADIVKSFARLAVHSRILKEKLPEESPPLRDALKLMLELLSTAKLANPDQRLLLPFTSAKDKTAETLFVQHLYWTVKGSGIIGRVFEREGPNLSFFLRQELANLSKENKFARIRDFEIARHRSDAIGRFRFYGKDYPLHSHALLQFVRAVIRTAPEPEAPLKVITSDVSSSQAKAPAYDWTRFSVVDCLDLFSLLLLKAEHVDFPRVQRFLPPERRGNNYQYRMHERWIFVLDRRGDVIDCLDKLSANARAPSDSRARSHSGPRSSSGRGGRGKSSRGRGNSRGGPRGGGSAV
jgi:hypothetical protein